MTTIKHTPYAEQPCERCGSKKKVSKTWKEKIPTFTGTTEVEFSQIICTNIECQKVFDENIVKDAKKREDVRVQREEREKVRKANSTFHAKTPVKSKSRI